MKLEEERGEDYREASLQERMRRDAAVIFYLEEVFEKRILAKLPTFKPITAEDLATAAFSQLSGIESESELREAFARFIAHLFTRVDNEGAGPFSMYNLYEAFEHEPDEEFAGNFSAPFDLGKWHDVVSVPYGGEGESPGSLFHTLWDSRSQTGFFFIVTPVKVAEDGLGISDWPEDRIEGYLVGDASPGAADAAGRELERWMPTIIRSFRILVCRLGQPRGGGVVRFGKPVVPYEQRVSLPYDQLASPFARAFFSECISNCVLCTDTLAQRVRNAIQLLEEADCQTSTAIGLSLCFSAIEALLCRKTEGITDELSRSVATLLEPDASQRLQVIKAIKQLYDRRSKALHGVSIDDDRQAWVRVRHLASGVLAAVADWADYQRRFPEKADRDTFLNRIQEDGVSGARMPEIREELRHCLPSLE